MASIDMLKDALLQGQKLAGLLDAVASRVEARRDAKDRVLHWLQDSFTFQQGQNTVQNLVFNVPKGFDFEAARLNVYLEIRLTTTDPSTEGPSDVVFRPTTWFNPIAEDSTGNLGPHISADALLELTYASPDGKNRRYQNAAFWAAQTFSDYMNVNSQGFRDNVYNRNESPSGLVFAPFYPLERGSTLTMRVTPTYSGIDQGGDVSGDEGNFEYRVRGVLEGYKRL